MRRCLLPLAVCLALLTACGAPEGPPTPTARPRAEQIAQLTQVAAAQEASAVARAATQTVQAQPTATATVAPTSTRPPTSTAAPTRTPVPPRPSTSTPPPLVPTPPPAAAALPYFDPLRGAAGGWTTMNFPETQLVYAPDGYHMRNERLGTWLESRHATLPSPADVSIEVEVTNLSPAVADNGFGVLCRFQDARNWYGFTASSDGRLIITRMYRGVERLLGVIDGGPAPGEKIRLRADCVGDTLTLSVDGGVRLQAQDSALASGAVRLYVCTCGGRGPIEARFVDMVVWAPDPAAPNGPAPAKP